MFCRIAVYLSCFWRREIDSVLEIGSSLFSETLRLVIGSLLYRGLTDEVIMVSFLLSFDWPVDLVVRDPDC